VCLHLVESGGCSWHYAGLLALRCGWVAGCGVRLLFECICLLGVLHVVGLTHAHQVLQQVCAGMRWVGDWRLHLVLRNHACFEVRLGLLVVAFAYCLNAPACLVGGMLLEYACPPGFAAIVCWHAVGGKELAAAGAAQPCLLRGAAGFAGCGFRLLCTCLLGGLHVDGIHMPRRFAASVPTFGGWESGGCSWHYATLPASRCGS
jgi:hypothetical protein